MRRRASQRLRHWAGRALDVVALATVLAVALLLVAWLVLSLMLGRVAVLLQPEF